MDTHSCGCIRKHFQGYRQERPTFELIFKAVKVAGSHRFSTFPE